MPETLEDQNLYPDPQVAVPVTYDALLKDTSIHPELVPHLQRLADEAAAPVVEQLKPLPPYPDQASNAARQRIEVVRAIDERSPEPGLDGLSANLQRLSRTMLEGPPANFGRSHYAPGNNVYDALEQGVYGTDQLARYIREARTLCDAFEDIAVRRNEFSDGSRYDGVLAALTSVPLDKLRAVYQSGELSHELRSMLESAHYEDELIVATSLLQRIYGHDDILDMWDPKSPAFHDPTFQELMTKEEVLPAITSVLERNTALWPEGADPMSVEVAKREWGDRFLERVAGLPKHIRDELQFDAYARTANAETGYVESKFLRGMLSRTAHNVRSLGVEKITRLHDRVGATNLDIYSDGQLNLLSAVLDGDKKAVEHLRAGDTTVVFMDAKGDRNGAMLQLPVAYGTNGNRTLAFEIKQPSDFYRHMLTLSKLGIKPSTLVLAAHGNAGSIAMGNAESRFKLVNKNTQKTRFIDRLPGSRPKQRPSEYNIMNARGFSRVVRDMMQDSRGIDDHDDAKGRRRIFVNTCLSAKPVPVTHYEERKVRGVRKMVSRITGRTPQDRIEIDESIGATITEAAAHPNIDVFANEESFGLHRTKNGERLVHVEPLESITPGEKPKLLPATQYRLDESGYVISRRINSVPLSQADDEELEQLLEAA